MATRDQPPPASAAGDDAPAAADRDDRAEQALARSRELRKQGRLLVEEAQERMAAAQRRSGPSARSRPNDQEPAARLLDADDQIERSRQARAHLAEVATKLVQAEEAVARIHDQMAGRDSGNAAQYRRTADHARQAPRRARDIQRDAAGSGPR